ncbi:type II secretion system protein GspM [Thiomicrospira sp. R3]|uniref:type II secretion system protein GspM n=1 Tax=Thiomicrospira sp. R3 TaxID=3035472 RepID=UPI00259B575A|nr:type II secretion system protein GspM [Thiomicrospira sp. R3]WFE69024.1 type II secretion system protein GspM [Thiomicrospira sp. R3]
MLMQTESLQPLIDRWQALAIRERILILALAVLLSVFVVYRFAWLPLQTQQQQAQQRLAIAEQQWQWLNQQIPAIQQAQSLPVQGKVQTQSQLLAHIQQSLRSENLMNQMASIRPAANGVQVVFNQVDAPRFFQWLASLEQQNLVAERLQVEPVSQGLVKVTLSYRLAL